MTWITGKSVQTTVHETKWRNKVAVRVWQGTVRRDGEEKQRRCGCHHRKRGRADACARALANRLNRPAE